MQVQPINSNNPNFGINFKLSQETIAMVEKSTKLSYNEMIHLSLDECGDLMKKRGTLKTSKIKLWLAENYRRFGEKMGLLNRPFYR